MTLDDLRKLAEAAKAWRPVVVCRNTYTGSTSYCGECDACLGAKRAAEDVAEEVEIVVPLLPRLIYESVGFTGKTVRHRDHAISRILASSADKVARIESYFGAPGVVAEFARALREFLNG